MKKMDKEHFTSFEDYKADAYKNVNVEKEKLSVKEIIAKAEKIRAMDKSNQVMR